MTTMDAIGAIIQRRLDPEEWGAAWLFGTVCAEKYQPEKGASLERFFLDRWKWHKIDKERVARGRDFPGMTPEKATVTKRRVFHAASLDTRSRHGTALRDEVAAPQAAAYDDTAAGLMEWAQARRSNKRYRHVKRDKLDTFTLFRGLAAGLTVEQTAIASGASTTLGWQRMRQVRADLAARYIPARADHPLTPSITEAVKCA